MQCLSFGPVVLDIDCFVLVCRRNLYDFPCFGTIFTRTPQCPLRWCFHPATTFKYSNLHHRIHYIPFQYNSKKTLNYIFSYLTTFSRFSITKLNALRGVGWGGILCFVSKKLGYDNVQVLSANFPVTPRATMCQNQCGIELMLLALGLFAMMSWEMGHGGCYYVWTVHWNYLILEWNTK